MSFIVNLVYSQEFIIGLAMLCSAWLVYAYCHWLSGGFK